MAEPARDAQRGEGSVELGGYQQALKRRLGSFQVSAISFAFISMAVGIFGTHDEVLPKPGPVGTWLWPLVTVGHARVASVYASC